MLILENVSKSFDGIRALKDFSLSVKPGEIVGVIGPNGAGKTTIFNVINGFVIPDSGKAMFNGSEILGLPPYKVARRGIARTFQKLRLIRRLSVMDNVLLSIREQQGEQFGRIFLKWKAIKKQEIENQKAAKSLLEKSDLADKANDPAENLSYGQQKLLSIVCCLVAGADLLLLDEPVAGIAPEMTKKILLAIRSLPEQGKSVIFIEHNLDAVLQICDRVIFMDAGIKISEGIPEQVWKDPKVLEAYLH